MGVKVTFEDKGVGAKVGSITTDPSVGQFVANSALQKMVNYVPLRSGSLRATGTATPFQVTYQTAYAPYVYYGDKLRFKTAGTRAHWEQGLNGKGLAAIAEEVTAYLKRSS